MLNNNKNIYILKLIIKMNSKINTVKSIYIYIDSSTSRLILI